MVRGEGRNEFGEIVCEVVHRTGRPIRLPFSRDEMKSLRGVGRS